MSPDPYNGSYDLGNPQSFNRYAYVGNNPLSFTDPLGLKGCGVNGEPACQGDGSQNQDPGEWWDPFDWGNIIASWFHHPAFHGTTHPRLSIKATGTFGSTTLDSSGGLQYARNLFRAIFGFWFWIITCFGSRPK
jgi:hypothetical protein